MGETDRVDAIALLKTITPLIETSGWAFTDEGALWLVGAQALLKAAKPPEQPCEVCGGERGFWISDKSFDSCSKCGGTGKKGGA